MVGPFGGSATYVAIDKNHPQTLFVGARNSLLYRSDDGGASWRLLPFPRNFAGIVESILIDPRNSQRLLVGVYDTASPRAGIYVSDDGGTTWSAVQSLSGISVQALAFAPNDPDHVIVGTYRGVFESRDSGRTFSRISPEGSTDEMHAITAVAFDPSNTDTILAGTTHLPWKSTDGGKNWRSIHNGLIDDSDIFSIYFNPKDPTQVFASACSGIYTSTTSGESWTKFKGIPGTHRRTHVIRQDPLDQKIIYAGTTVGLMRTTDGGVTWKQLNQLYINSLAIDPTDPKRIYFATEHAGIWRTDDRGETAVALNTGFVNRRANRLTAQGNTIYLNTVQDGTLGGVFSSDDSGTSWKLRASNASFADSPVHSLVGSHGTGTLLFAATEDRLFKSVDGGKTWRPVAFRPTPKTFKIEALLLLRAKAPVLFAGTSAGLFQSLNNGLVWKEVKLAGKTGTPVISLHISPDGASRIAARTATELFVSDDGGAQFRSLGAPPVSSSINDLALANDGNQPILVATAEGLFAVRDASSWTLVAGGLPASTVDAVRYHPQNSAEAFAVQYGRLYRSADGGSSWSAVPDGVMEGSRIRSLWIAPQDPDKVFALTADMGVLLLKLADRSVHQ